MVNEYRLCVVLKKIKLYKLYNVLSKFLHESGCQNSQGIQNILSIILKVSGFLLAIFSTLVLIQYFEDQTVDNTWCSASSSSTSHPSYLGNLLEDG